MEEFIVTELAQLSGVPVEELKETLADETKSKEFFETYRTTNVIYKKDEFDKLLSNKELEYLEAHAKADKIHPAIYKRVDGTVKEMTEKVIAKRFGVTDYSGLDDLLEKAEAKLKVADNSDEKDAKINKLKKLVKTVEKEKEDAVISKSREVDGFIISSVMTSAIADLPIDFEGDQLKIQREIVSAMFEKKYIIERKENKIIAIDRVTGEVKKDRVGDPVEVSQLLTEFAPTVTKIKNVPAGGRGDNSSHNNNTTDLAKVTNAKDWKALLETKGITNEGSKEAGALLAEVRKANPDFKMI